MDADSTVAFNFLKMFSKTFLIQRFGIWYG